MKFYRTVRLLWSLILVDMETLRVLLTFKTASLEHPVVGIHFQKLGPAEPPPDCYFLF